MDSIAVVSMDIHKRFSKAVAFADDGTIVEEARIVHESRLPMQEYLSRFPKGTAVVMEATFNWPWIADTAESLGLEPHLAHPLRLRKYAKGLPKTDRKDAIFQGRVWLSGDLFPEVYRAPTPVRRMRAGFRLRLLWVRMRTALKNNIHGQLLKLGLTLDQEASDIFSPKGRRVLEGLELEEQDRSELERKLRVVDQLSENIEILDREMSVNLKRDERASILMSLPGVGEKTAYAILAEVGEFSRFANGRALASYAGLLPVPDQSGERDGERRTSRASNHFLRWAMMEAVTGAVRCSSRMASLSARVRARNPKRPGKARVAVARQLAELAHLLVTRNVKYQESYGKGKRMRKGQSKS